MVSRFSKPGRRKLIIFLAFLGVALYAVFGDKGLLDVYALKRERDGIVAFNRTMEAENRQMEARIERLKTDERYIGYIARTELGMIGPNEVIYRIEGE